MVEQETMDKLILAIEETIDWFEFDGGAISGQLIIDKLADAAGEAKREQR